MFEAIGRSQRTANSFGMIREEMARARQDALRQREMDMREKRYGLLNDATEVELNMNREKLSAMRQQEEFLNQSLPVDVVANGIKNETYRRLLTDHARMNGYIDESGGIKRKYIRQVFADMNDPNNPLSQTMVDENLKAARHKYSQLVEAQRQYATGNKDVVKGLGLKNDRDLAEAIQAAQQEYMMAQGANEKYMNAVKAMTDQRNADAAYMRSMQPNAVDGAYTLNPGAVRYDADGNVISENPKPAENANEDYTLSPGSRRYNTRGEIIAENPASPPSPEKLTQKEKDIQNRVNVVPKLEEMTPVERARRGWKVNDDGSLFIEADTGAAVKLPSFYEATGKRGQVAEIKRMGEYRDDAMEVQALLADQKVMSDLNAVSNAGYWDNTKGKWKNSVRKWLATNGIGKNDKTYEAMMRMERLASAERHDLLGAAVTKYEMNSVRPFLINSGDSFDTIMTKINLMATEGDQQFVRWLDLYKNDANMQPFYDAFGVDRFAKLKNAEMDADALIQKYSQP